jgi:hypothetical protein
MDSTEAESLLFNIPAIDRLNREALSLDCQPSFSGPSGQLFQKRPGAQDTLLDDSKIEMGSAGFVLMDYKSRTYQVLAPDAEM